MVAPIEVVGPAGERGTVDAADVAAMGPGWRTLSPEELHTEGAEAEWKDALGPAAAPVAAIYGAGRSASLGASDAIAKQAAYLAGGDQARTETLRALNLAKEGNPTANTVGELGGLLVGGVPAIGEAAEGLAASRLSEGLLGSAAKMAARGGAEGAAIGAQQAFSEDTLGDHEYNGQAIFANAAKDGLLGAATGAALGTAGGLLGRAFGGLLRKTPGPTSDALLDEVAGAPGAGRLVQQDARASQDLVNEMRQAGATSEQAVSAIDSVRSSATQAAEHGSPGPLSGLVDSTAEAYKGARRALGGMNDDLEEVMNKGYAERHARIAQQEQAINGSAAKLSKSLTGMLRNTEDTANDLQFTQRPEQFAKLVDTSLVNVQRDTVASLLQDADETLKFWEGTAAKGGMEGTIKSLRRTWQDALDSMAKIENDATPTMSRDLNVKTNMFKQALDRTLQWGREGRYGLPEAIQGVGGNNAYGLEPLANRFRSALEDESVWGQAGRAQAEANASFSDVKARRDDLANALGVAIDQKAGIRIREGDFAKAKALLNQLTGDETDSLLQPIKSAEATISGLRNRDAVMRKFYSLSPGELSKLDQGLRDVADFERELASARKEAGAINRLKRQQLQEQAHGIGGLFGVLGDAASKPLTTMERLAGIKHTAQTIEKGVAGGLKRFFGQSGGEVLEKITPRAREESIREMTHIREMAGNQAMLESRVQRLAGDLPSYAPKTAEEVKSTARRAILYLAKETPAGITQTGLLGVYKQKPRYSDQQISEWESKRRGALGAINGTDAPRTVVAEMKEGRLNREALKAMEYVSPKLFAMVQDQARNELVRMEEAGLLDTMPMQQKAAIASLLQIAPDGTWTPDFLQLMKAAQATPAPTQGQQSTGGPPQGARKASHPMPDVYGTALDRIEGKAA